MINHMNDVIVKHQNKPKDPVQTLKRKEVLIVLPFLGYHSKHLTKQLRSCINKLYGIFNVKIVFQNTRRIKSFFPYKDKLAPSFRSKVVYRANFWNCNDFCIGKTKRRFLVVSLLILIPHDSLVFFKHTHEPCSLSE